MVDSFLNTHERLKDDLPFAIFLVLKLKEYENFSKSRKGATLSWVRKCDKILQCAREADGLVDGLEPNLCRSLGSSVRVHFNMLFNRETPLDFMQELSLFLFMASFSQKLKTTRLSYIRLDWSTPSVWQKLGRFAMENMRPADVLRSLQSIKPDAWKASNMQSWALLEPFLSTLSRQYNVQQILGFVSVFVLLDWNPEQIHNFSQSLLAKTFIEERDLIQVLYYFSDKYSESHPTLLPKEVDEFVFRGFADRLQHRHELALKNYKTEHPRVFRVLAVFSNRRLGTLPIDRAVSLMDEEVLDTAQWNSEKRLHNLTRFAEKGLTPLNLPDFQKAFTHLCPDANYALSEGAFAALLKPLTCVMKKMSLGHRPNAQDRVTATVGMLTFVLCIPSYIDLVVRAMLAVPRSRSKVSTPATQSFKDAVLDHPQGREITRKSSHLQEKTKIL